MKILITVFVLIGQFQSSFSQESIRSAIIENTKNADSLIRLINSTELIEKRVQGSVEPFSDVSGIAFLNKERTEIKKMQLTSLTTQEVVTYYCIDNKIRVITCSHALYYRYNEEWSVFHSIKNADLLTQKQLQLQEEFLKNVTMTLMKH